MKLHFNMIDHYQMIYGISIVRKQMVHVDEVALLFYTFVNYENLYNVTVTAQQLHSEIHSNLIFLSVYVKVMYCQKYTILKNDIIHVM